MIYLWMILDLFLHHHLPGFDYIIIHIKITDNDVSHAFFWPYNPDVVPAIFLMNCTSVLAACLVKLF